MNVTVSVDCIDRPDTIKVPLHCRLVNTHLSNNCYTADLSGPFTEVVNALIDTWGADEPDVLGMYLETMKNDDEADTARYDPTVDYRKKCEDLGIPITDTPTGFRLG